MSNIVISDLKPVQSKYEEICDSKFNSIMGGGELKISPYIDPYVDLSGKLGMKVGVSFTFKF